MENSTSTAGARTPKTPTSPRPSAGETRRNGGPPDTQPQSGAASPWEEVVPRQTTSQDASRAQACDAPGCTLLTTTDDPVNPDAQRRWAARPIHERLQPFQKARGWIATHTALFAQSVSHDLQRSQADTLIAEILPLLDAIRFLEKNAARLLAPRKLGARHRPLWLTGIQSELHRDPLGHVLVIGPANFPLFLPGAQTAQALVAGNAVTWKPGAGGEKVARLFAHVLREAGLPRGILHITGDSVEAAQTALAQHPDKVVFTGSANTGCKLLHTLADSITPATLELSGADAVIVLPSADLPLAAKAIAFGLRLNGAEVCMSPRRLLALPETLAKLRPLLQAELAKVPPIPLKPQTAQTLQALLAEALAGGAKTLNLREPSSSLETSSLGTSSLETSSLEAQQDSAPAPPLNAGQMSLKATSPILVDHATPHMANTRTDLFAPVLSLIEAPSVLHLPDLANNNPYALTAAIFGNPREAGILALQLRVGTVLINDLIAPTADPRTPFGGRGQSGFGLTRGGEGLLEMTAPKTILRRAKGTSLHYDPLRDKDLPLFTGLIGTLHASTLRHRWQSLKQLIRAARTRH